MNYVPIDRANLLDAARHLEDARRMKDAGKIAMAAEVLREQLAQIKQSNAQLHAEFVDLLEGEDQ